MRKAYIGLSSPVGYNYNNGFEKKFGKPNPIIDSPMGLFLFYDEIWFINRRTCPINCEKLPYVKFLDEEYDLSKYGLEQFSWKNNKLEQSLDRNVQDEFWKEWKSTLNLNLNNEVFGIDNHSRGINYGGNWFTPNPTALNLVIDDYLATEFGLELITNSATKVYALTNSESQTDLNKSKLTQILLCENIPNFQLELGPYHDFIEDLRSESLLKNYRNKINSVIKDEQTDISEVKVELENAMNKYLYELVLNRLDKAQIFNGIFNAGIGQVPILGNVYSGLDGGKTIYDNIKSRKEYGWVGFIAKSRLNK